MRYVLRDAFWKWCINPNDFSVNLAQEYTNKFFVIGNP